MNNAFADISSSAMTSYSARINTWEDLVEDNPHYNPLLYIVSDGIYNINPEYDPYKKLWNKYVFDNNQNFWQYIESTGILSETDAYGNPIVNEDEIPDEFKEGFIIPVQTNRLDHSDYGNDGNFAYLEGADRNIFGNTNYFIAPDIFRYCSNNAKLTLNSIFMNSSEYKGDDVINGFRGTVPEFIFEPITSIKALDSIFSNCEMLYPFKWREYEESGDILGTTYPPKLLYGLTSLENVSYLFSGTRVWGNTIIDANMLKDCATAILYKLIKLVLKA